MPVETRPVIVNATGLCIRYSKQVVLDGAALTVHDGERVGVVGRNGTGKSTLLKILAGAELVDSGEIARKRDSVTGFLPQEAQLDVHETVRDCILSGAKDVLDLIHRFETLPHDSPEHVELEHRIAAREGWTIERRMDELITRIGAPDPERQVDTLSGGEKRRVALCRALISQPDLLLLDEPTNHLDTEAIDWLEEFITRRCHTCIFVTHDRYFLDRVATRVIELSNGALYSHPGNYTAFLDAKAKREEMAEQEEARRQAFIRREIDWVRRGPKARGTKSRSRLDRFYAAAEKDGPEKELDIDLVIPPAPRLANRVVELHDVGMAYGERRLFSGLDYQFEAGDCVGIVGRNGLGKTTLLKIMLGQVEPTEGRVAVGERTEYNYVDQLRLKLNDEESVWDAVGEGHEFVWLGDHRISMWTYLRRFMFTDERIKTPVGQLSGGERNRLLLAKILRRGGNFLILDEPTNDLDLSTLRMLEEALLAFRGCVVVVSHDRFFLNRVCSGILAFEGDGRVVYQEGDYDYYVAKRREREEAEKMEAELRAPQESLPRSPKKRRGLTWKQERELEGMESAILAVESEIERVESLFSQPDFFEKHGSQAGELKAELELKQEELAALYDRWEELEAIKAGE